MKVIEVTEEVKPVEAQPARYVVELTQDEADFIRDILGNSSYGDYSDMHHYFSHAEFRRLYNDMSNMVRRWDIRKEGVE